MSVFKDGYHIQRHVRIGWANFVCLEIDLHGAGIFQFMGVIVNPTFQGGQALHPIPSGLNHT